MVERNSTLLPQINSIAQPSLYQPPYARLPTTASSLHCYRRERLHSPWEQHPHQRDSNYQHPRTAESKPSFCTASAQVTHSQRWLTAPYRKTPQKRTALMPDGKNRSSYQLKPEKNKRKTEKQKRLTTSRGSVLHKCSNLIRKGFISLIIIIPKIAVVLIALTYFYVVFDVLVHEDWIIHCDTCFPWSLTFGREDKWN